jgi:hypothetical protein
MSPVARQEDHARGRNPASRTALDPQSGTRLERSAGKDTVSSQDQTDEAAIVAHAQLAFRRERPWIAA